MKLGKLGVFCFTDALTPAQLIDLAKRTEGLGFSALWYAEALGYESFSLGGFLLSHTQNLIVASGIANIYARDPTAMKQGQHSLAKMHGGRFLLGMGVSHASMVEGARGHQYGKPVSTMRAYLAAMEKATAYAPPLQEPPPSVLGALGPKMTRLAGERTDGVMLYNMTPEHTARTREIVGSRRWVCVEQKVLLIKDASRAREVARRILAPTLTQPNYRNSWLRLGFTEGDFADGGTDGFIDAVVAWGEDSAVRDRIQAHFAAGADHVCIQPLRPDGQRLIDMDALAVLAP